MKAGGLAQFYYSEQGKEFIPFGTEFNAVQGRWVGAKIGLFSSASTRTDEDKLSTTKQQTKSTTSFADFADFQIKAKTNH